MSDFPFSIPRRTNPVAAGGAAGFTPVLHTGRWNTNSNQQGNRTIVGDDIIENIGITPGNGTQNIPYGVSTPNDNVGYFKVSEEMSGIYTFTISINATASSATYDEGPSVHFSKFQLVNGSGVSVPVLAANNSNQADQTDQKTFLFSVTTRLEPEQRLDYRWVTSFKIKGNNTSNPGGWFSIAKIAN